MIHLIKTKKPRKKEAKRYQVRQADKDFDIIDTLDDPERKLATFYGNEAFEVTSKKSAPQRMAEKVARDMNEAWDKTKHLFAEKPEEKKDE